MNVYEQQSTTLLYFMTHVIVLDIVHQPLESERTVSHKHCEGDRNERVVSFLAQSKSASPIRMKLKKAEDSVITSLGYRVANFVRNNFTAN
jgi:hypothetical protein